MSKVNHEIAVQDRNERGTGASRRFRKAGQIPAVIYSKGKEAKSVTVAADSWAVLAGHHVKMVMLENGGKKIPALVKEVQFNYLKNYVVHIDFQEVDMNEDIHAKVTVHPHGDCVGVNRGGILEIEIHELDVICHPDKLPEAINVDVTNLELGGQIHVKDLVLPEGVSTDVDPEAIVLHVGRAKEEAASEPEVTEPEAIKEKKADSE